MMSSPSALADRSVMLIMFGIWFLRCRHSATAGGPVHGRWPAELDGWSSECCSLPVVARSSWPGS